MSYQVGVDLGATFTAAAVCRGGRAEAIPFGPRAAFVPSVAYTNQDGSLVLGDAAEQRALNEPDRVARQFIRRVGDGTPLRLGGVSMTADALAARYVGHVVSAVAGVVGAPASRVALTHPAGWGQHRIASLHQALVVQGLGATVFLSGAQAAARAYAETTPIAAGDLVAVYDLGGSGFDAAVVRKMPDGRFASAGRPEELEVGGLDFDELVFEHVRGALGERWANLNPDDPAMRPALARLRRECTRAKEALSADTDVQIPVALPGLDARVRLARAEFEELVRPTIEETAAMLHRAIDAAGSAPEDVAAVVLTGGSARIPLVTQVVSEILGRPVTVAANPKADTAIGAALAIGGLDAETPAAEPAPEPTRIVLRAAPEPAARPSRPPVVAFAAPDRKGPRFGLSRTFATVAAAATALLVGGGIVLASQNGPRGADAETKLEGSTGNTEQTVTTEPETTTTKTKPAPTPRRTSEPRRTVEEQPPTQEEPTNTSEPTESTSTVPDEDSSVAPPSGETTTTTTTTTSPDTGEPSEEQQQPADPGQAERPQS